MSNKRKNKENKEKEDGHLEYEGVVVEALRGGVFKVRVDELDTTLQVSLSGKIRHNKVRVLLGDRVQVKVSAYDPRRGMITYRFRDP